VDNPGRFAFTVAHEIGHWRLHRPLFEMQELTLPLFPSRAGAAAGPASCAEAPRERRRPSGRRTSSPPGC
jgi:hypothetical protein